MPIKGLTDRGLAFPEIGRIRKGAPKPKDGKPRPGAELPHFRVEFASGEEKAKAVFESVYGKTPKNIRVLFPWNDIKQAWDPWFEAYTAGRRVGRSDGEFIESLTDEHGEVLVSNWLDRDGNKVPHRKIAGKDYQGKPVEFKQYGRLRVMVPELQRAAELIVITTSVYDIGNISDQLRAYKEINGGRFAGIPFIIRRVPALISTPGENKGQRVRRLKHLISVEVDPEWAKAKFGELNHLALPNFSGDVLPVAELPAGDPVEYEPDDDEVEAEDVLGEEETTEEIPAKEMVDVMSPRCVEYAAKYWNSTNEQAAIDLAKMKLGKTIEWTDFVQIVQEK